MKLFLFILLNSIVINKVSGQLYNVIDIKIEVGAKRKISKVDVECADTAMAKNITERFSNFVFPKERPPKGNYLVKVQYVVAKDSSIAEVKCLTNVGYGLEAEAVRAIRGPIRWGPAPQGGRQVREFRR
jgi:hypothetical protein